MRKEGHRGAGRRNMKNYFDFTPEEEAYLQEVNEDFDRALSPYAAPNREAVRENGYLPRNAIVRPPYFYDTDCILHNPLYNRYADKTQVFSFYRNDDLTRRALHVQFVSKIARTIGRALRLNLELIEAIALGHDMGHTPFGHKGESFLSECYQEGTAADGLPKRYFFHNVHSVRIFRCILRSNLTLQTLSGILAHNGEKVCREYAPSPLGTFEEFDQTLEQCYLDPDFHKTLRPNTLEGCVVRLSDMIAYAGKDRQDLYRAGLISKAKFDEKRLIGTRNRDIVSNLINNILKNSIRSSSINMDEEVFEDLRDLVGENYKVIYEDKDLNRPYFDIVQPLMQKLYARLKADLQARDFSSPVFTHYLNDRIQGRNYRDADRRIIADPNDIVTDFIASMTDDYFIDICRHLHLDDELLSQLRYREYFDDADRLS